MRILKNSHRIFTHSHRWHPYAVVFTVSFIFSWITKGTVEIRQMQDDELLRQAIVMWLTQQDVSKANWLPLIAQANRKTRTAIRPSNKLWGAMLDIMTRARLPVMMPVFGGCGENAKCK